MIWGLLLLTIQPIELGDKFIVIDVLTNIVDQENSSLQPNVLDVRENITVSFDTEEYGWLEMNITEGIRILACQHKVHC